MIKVLHVFTEEASARNVFESILPRLLPQDVNYRIYSHQGKQDLEKATKYRYLSGDVELITFNAMKRVCHTCCDMYECDQRLTDITQITTSH